MRRPTRLQFLLMRMDQPSRQACRAFRLASGLSLIEASTRRYEMALCALVQSHERLRISEKVLTRGLHRIAAYAERQATRSTCLGRMHGAPRKQRCGGDPGSTLSR